MKKGLILLNLGTPLNPSVEEVRSYLREFLMDPFVLDIPTPLRWLLVNGIIAPFRAPKSAHAYQSIWMDEGSPLLVYTKRFLAKVRAEISNDWVVEAGMTYGSPSFTEALQNAQQAGVGELWVVPLFPQWALAAGGAAIYSFKKVLAQSGFKGQVKFLRDYHNSPSYISTLASQVREFSSISSPSLGAQKLSPHYLLSFHSLPVRQVLKTTPSYSEQCYQTAKLLAKQMGWSEQDYSVSFQSRLGRAKWLQPYTAEVLQSLPQRGVKNLAVLCPGFSVDCLETLEEINIGGREIFMKAGGESFSMLPCVNDHDVWVKNFIAMLGEPNLVWVD